MDVKSFYKRKERDEEGWSFKFTTHARPTEKKARLRPSTSSHVKRIRCLLHRQLDADTLWRVFPRQKMAFDFAGTCWQSAVVFAFESEELGHEGQRKYLVTTYHHFSQQYLAMEPPRHFYEIIPEGAVCRLYFDIEYKLGLNPGVQPTTALETFIEYVCYQLSVCFQLSCSRSQILDLDSSTETKFSRHLIFHLPGAVFFSNIHIGNWVHYICDELRALRREVEGGMDSSQAWRTLFTPNTQPLCPPAEKLLALFVSTERGDVALICDEGVYTRNRNFRLFLSSKLGKGSCLRTAKENRFKAMRRENVQKKSYLVNVFLDSLICNVSYGTSSRIMSFEPCGESIGRRRKRRCVGAASVGVSSAGSEGYSSSPFPLVDSFITSCINRGGVQGAIRRWSYFQQERLMVYDIKHNRWCDNIQRAHKSNNIMIIADLQRGVYYQKCHDPVCKSINFKSIERDIPGEVNPFSVGPAASGGGGADREEGLGEWLGPGDLPLEQLQAYSLEEEEEEAEEGAGGGLDNEAILARVAEEMDLDFPSAVGETVPPVNSELHTALADPPGQSSLTRERSLLLSSQEEDLPFDAAYDAYESGVHF